MNNKEIINVAKKATRLFLFKALIACTAFYALLGLIMEESRGSGMKVGSGVALAVIGWMASIAITYNYSRRRMANLEAMAKKIEYIEDLNPDLTKDVVLGSTVYDQTGWEHEVLEKTKTSVRIYTRKKVAAGIDCYSWVSWDNFKKHYKDVKGRNNIEIVE